jgi:hypothetical protein
MWKVVERKLGREKAWGLCYDGIIEIDPRQNSKEYLDTAIHEMLHLVMPEMKEEDVARSARKMASVLWRLGYRRVRD